jgi:hypothetical protein
MAEDIDNLGGSDALLDIVKEALTETKDYVNNECEAALNSSKYSFDKGVNYSQGDARRSLNRVKQMPVEVEGTEVTAYAGFDLDVAPEVLPLAYGTPHLAKDSKLYNAIKVKGGVKKEIDKIQSEIFTNALARLVTEGGNG